MEVYNWWTLVNNYTCSSGVSFAAFLVGNLRPTPPTPPHSATAHLSCCPSPPQPTEVAGASMHSQPECRVASRHGVVGSGTSRGGQMRPYCQSILIYPKHHKTRPSHVSK